MSAENNLQSILYQRGSLKILNQRLLPEVTEYIPIENAEDGWNAIRKMQVRGAPAIAMVGCLSLAVELNNTDFSSLHDFKQFVVEKMDYLVTARPTAVNMGDSAAKGKYMVKRMAEESQLKPVDAKLKLIESFEEMLQNDINDNKKVGQFGADHILSNCGKDRVSVMTHCNTGSLATAGYGTALGVIRSLHEQKKLNHAYCTETRPYNQGARLTAYEFVHEKIPSTLICDSMAAACMKQKEVDAIVVGADRVVANGDAANKIGTYQLAVLAKFHQIPFYVACPRSSYDSTIDSGDSIKIEERPHNEMTSIKDVQIAAKGIGCWNPAFDVTPANLITGGIITEYGVFNTSEVKEKFQEFSRIS